MPHVVFPGARCCGNCRFGRPINPGLLECRRHPPQFTSREDSDGQIIAEAAFPAVERSLWCGHHVFARRRPHDDEARGWTAVLEWLQVRRATFHELCVEFVNERHSHTAYELKNALRDLEKAGAIGWAPLTGAKPDVVYFATGKNSCAAPSGDATP